MKTTTRMLGLVGVFALIGACSGTTTPAAAPAGTTLATSSATTSTTLTTPTAPVAESLPLLVIQPLIAGTAPDFGVIRPTDIVFSADGRVAIVGITWTSWTATGAVGHGTLLGQSCVPNCASGAVARIPATIVLSHPVNGEFTSLAQMFNGGTHTSSGPEFGIVGAGASPTKLPLPAATATAHPQVTAATVAPTSTTLGVSSCTVAALTTAAKAGSPGFYSLDTAHYGCSGAFAYAGVIVGPAGSRTEGTALFMARSGSWVEVPRTYCDNGSVPAAIFQAACNSN